VRDVSKIPNGLGAALATC